MKIFTSKIIDYLQSVIPDFKFSKSGKLFTCPVCRDLKCNIIGDSNKIFCLKCHKSYGDIFDVVKLLEVNKYKSKDEIVTYLASKFNIDYITEEQINKALDFYQLSKFDLLPVVGNTKIPGEKEWTIKEHKNKEEWLSWIKDGLNLGIKAGERSGITVLDFDTKNIDQNIKKLLNKTLSVETDRGFHYIYFYEPQLNTTRIDNLKLDIINNGKQFVVFPSIIDGKRRKELEGKIEEMSPELLKFIKEKTNTQGSVNIVENCIENIKREELSELKDINFNYIGEGNRNHFLLHVGGILSKQMNTVQVENTLSIINRICCKPPYPQKELENIIKSLNKYENRDEKSLATKILSYLRIVGDASRRDIKEVVGESKEKTDRAIAYLEKEEYVYRKKGSYHTLKKIEWKDTFYEEDKLLDFKVPYFDDVAIFRPGDLILIGGQQKIGKTHQALNIIKQLVEQGKKPRYFNLESGNRFAKIAKQLGMKDTDFYINANNISPEELELTDDDITIIDWLLPSNYAESDKLFQHFIKELCKHRGLLIIYVQLRTDGNFFAKDMIAFFPAFVCRYFYDKDSEGKDTPTQGKFVIDYMRESKKYVKKWEIPCRYSWETKRLTRVDELPNINKVKEIFENVIL